MKKKKGSTNSGNMVYLVPLVQDYYLLEKLGQMTHYIYFSVLLEFDLHLLIISHFLMLIFDFKIIFNGQLLGKKKKKKKKKKKRKKERRKRKG